VSRRDEAPDDLLVHRLRSVLEDRADATTTSPDAWARIDARTRDVRPLRRRAIGTTVVVGLAAALVVSALVASSRGDDDGTVSADELGPGALLRLVPSVVPDGYAFSSVNDVATVEPTASGDASLVVGPPTSAGELPTSFVHVMAYDDEGASVGATQAFATGAGGDATATTAGDDPVSASAEPSDPADEYLSDPVSGTINGWFQVDGLSVAVVGRGVTEAELTEVVDGLTPVAAPAPGEPLAEATDLPTGWATLYEGSLSELYAHGASSTLEYLRPTGVAPGERLTVTVWRTIADPDLSLEPYVDATGWLAWTEVRGRQAVATVELSRDPAWPDTTRLLWVEQPGTLVSVAGPIDVDTARQVADGLQVVDESAWRDLYALANG
jgi:hypothetical protein